MSNGSDQSAVVFPVKQEKWCRVVLATAIVALALALGLGAGPGSPLWALSVSESYLLSDWASPTATTAAPFVVSGASGFQLSLNSLGVATSATLLVAPLQVQTTDRLYYQTHSGTIDPNEVTRGTLASRVNSEISKVDDAGLVNESEDASLNIDFKTNASVTLRTATPAVGVTGLIIFEDAGLDPFSLRYCYNAACTVSDLLFNGFSASTTSALLSSGAFGTDDYAPGIDQAFWFIFDKAATGGYFKIADSQNFGGSQSERLEVDFIGVTSGVTAARVPEPSMWILLAAGLFGFPLIRRAANC
jgi:hypothetical protein